MSTRTLVLDPNEVLVLRRSNTVYGVFVAVPLGRVPRVVAFLRPGFKTIGRGLLREDIVESPLGKLEAHVLTLSEAEPSYVLQLGGEPILVQGDFGSATIELRRDGQWTIERRDVKTALDHYFQESAASILSGNARLLAKPTYGGNVQGATISGGSGVSPPLIALVWDPSVLTEDEYAELVGILGDAVRFSGGAGLRRIIEENVGIATAEVPA